MDARRRILVVDDEAQNRDLMEAILGSFGYATELADCGLEALEKLNPSIDLVLLDVMMPRMDGFHVARRIREDPDCGDVPIIMITSLTTKEDRLRGVEAGANDFISKPIDRVELRVRMASLLKIKEAQDELKRHRDELEATVMARTAALRESERRYRTLFEDSLDAILIVSPDGRIIDVNQAFVELTGYDRDEIEDGPIERFLADPSTWEGFKEALVREGRLRDYELRMRRKDGTCRDCVLSASVGRSWDRKLVGFRSIIRDVTDRKRTAQALRASEERMRLLIESSPIGIMIAQEGKYSYVNPAFVAIFAYETPQAIVGLPLDALYAPEQRASFLEKVANAMSNEQAEHYHEIRGLRRTGQAVDLSVWMRAIEFGREPALLGFFVDVSGEKALKARLLQAQKMEAIGTLAGGIAHDFNNILYVIMGYTELALEEAEAGSRLHENMEQVLQASLRARDMVQQILMFSRQAEEQNMPVEVGPIAKETVKFLRASVPTTIEIQSQIPSDLGPIMSNPTHVHQVLMNLCTNAAHAMRERGGVLWVRLERLLLDADKTAQYPELIPGPHLLLTVGDTGHGMTAEVMERIFEPYFTTKRLGEGTGLGLSVVHGIVKGHGGTITVSSEPGLGSTFRVYLPIHEDGAVIEDLATQDAFIGNERILFVDDEPAVVEMGQQTLERLGYRVAGCTSSSQAMEMFRAQPDGFDLVITDMTMPAMTGMELAAALKTVRSNIPVILCTGFSELITEHRAREAGISALVMKPILKNEIAETIRQVLDQSTERM